MATFLWETCDFKFWSLIAYKNKLHPEVAIFGSEGMELEILWDGIIGLQGVVVAACLGGI